jgi:hypothetical protein
MGVLLARQEPPGVGAGCRRRRHTSWSKDEGQFRNEIAISAYNCSDPEARLRGTRRHAEIEMHKAREAYRPLDLFEMCLSPKPDPDEGARHPWIMMKKRRTRGKMHAWFRLGQRRVRHHLVPTESTPSVSFRFVLGRGLERERVWKRENVSFDGRPRERTKSLLEEHCTGKDRFSTRTLHIKGEICKRYSRRLRRFARFNFFEADHLRDWYSDSLKFS